MRKPSIALTLKKLAIVFAAVASVVALSIGGCSRAADRTLKIYQFQSTDTYAGQFQIDTSQLPPDAIKERSDSGGKGSPVSSLTVDKKYPIRILLVPASDDKLPANSQKPKTEVAD